MITRQVIAALSLAGVFIASYLALHKLGYFGELVCAVGACEVVNASHWATFAGAPVAAWGVGYYVTIFAVAMAGMGERFAHSRAVAGTLLALGAIGFLFSAWLTYLELFVIHAICQWCVVSALLATGILIAAGLDYRAVMKGAEATYSGD